MITLQGKVSASGFLLENPIDLEEGITVLTGKNGSGKTRLLLSVQRRETTIHKEAEELTARVFVSGSLIPSFGDAFRAESYAERVEKTIESFKRFPASYEHYNPFSNIALHTEGVGYLGLCMICKSATKRTGKAHAELSAQDIRNNYKEYNSDLFGGMNISMMFNGYLKHRNDLQYEEFKSILNSEDNKSITRDDLRKVINKEAPPWTTVNEILEDVLAGKFLFTVPDESLQTYQHESVLIDSKSKARISIEDLSSGERTLIWLVLTLCNTQYHETSVVPIPDVLFLDEPDAHLHPAMVVKMYEILGLLVKRFGVSVILTTHSPTTVALAPGAVYTVENNSINYQDKDLAISSLLNGVTQISVNPDNRRQVYMENRNDALVYERAFRLLKGNVPYIDPKISLTFLAAGKQTPVDHLRDCVRRSFAGAPAEVIDEFIATVNGSGDCGQVEAAVRSLGDANNRTVRGIVDWDLSDRPRAAGVTIAAQGYAYSIENILLDPIAILHMSRSRDADKYNIEYICGESVSVSTWLTRQDLLQNSVDKYLMEALGIENSKNRELKYANGLKLRTDSKYLEMKGETLQDLVFRAYPKIGFYKKNNDKGFAVELVNYIDTQLGWEFLPFVLAETLAKVQG